MRGRARFVPDYVPSSYAAIVQRRAVLDRLYLSDRSPEGICTRTLRTSSLWRRTLQKLQAQGWRPHNTWAGYWNAINCLPTFVYCTPRTRMCNNQTICPFCWARRVAETWQQVDDAITKFDPQDVKLIDRWHVHYMAYDGISEMRKVKRRENLTPTGATPEELTAYEVNLRKWLTTTIGKRPLAWKAVRPIGALLSTSFEPMSDGWRITNRQLWLVPADFQFEGNLAEFGKKRELRICNRREVMQAVARSQHYPEYLLRGPADMLAMLLRVRRKVRMSATVGVFRKRAERFV